GAGLERLAGLVLAVQEPQRVDVVAAAAVAAAVVQLVGVIGAQLVDVGRPAFRVADAVQVQGIVPQAQGVVERPQEVDYLSVDRWALVADGLDAKLVVLAVAPGLGAVVAEHGADIEEPDGLRARAHAVLDVGPADAGGELRAQGQPVAASVLEEVDLLFGDVGAGGLLPQPDARVLERRHVDAPVAVGLRDAGRRLAQPLPVGLVFRQDVGNAPGGSELLLFGHGLSSIGSGFSLCKGEPSRWRVGVPADGPRVRHNGLVIDQIRSRL